MHFDMIRAGIITYGYYPDEITAEYLQKNNKLENINKTIKVLEPNTEANSKKLIRKE